jgi:hypothetical protein
MRGGKSAMQDTGREWEGCSRFTVHHKSDGESVGDNIREGAASCAVDHGSFQKGGGDPLTGTGVSPGESKPLA